MHEHFPAGSYLTQADVDSVSATRQIDPTIDLGGPARALPQGPLAVTLRQGVTATVMDADSSSLGV